jgi:hypothetical protein
VGEPVAVYSVEVDVAVARPPTRANTRTVYVRVAVPVALPDWLASVEARDLACGMAAGVLTWLLPGTVRGAERRVVMPVATRVVNNPQRQVEG